MKTATKVALIIAACLIAAGILLWGISFAAAHGNWDAYRVDTDTYVKKTAEYDGARVKTIILTDPARDVELVRADGEHIVITYEEGEKSGYAIALSDDGTLTIDFYSEQKWYEWFSLSFGMETHKTVIAIPAGFEGNIEMHLESADLRTDGLSLAGDFTAVSASGNITLAAVELEGALSVRTTSGDVRISSCKAEEAAIRSTSGDAKIDTLTCARLSLTGVSADMDVQNITCSGDLALESTSGDIELLHVDAAGDIRCQSTSGDIELEQVRGRDIMLTSTSGDVRGEIIGSASDYHIDAKTTSGTVRIPDTYGSEKHIRIQTTSGNIRISLLSDQ